MGNYDGQVQSVRRRYDSLRNYIGQNEVHKAGDILYVSTKNNGNYDLIIEADGIHSFSYLYLQYKKGGAIPVEPNNDKKLNTFDEIVSFLEGLPEGSNLKEILQNLNTGSLTDEERELLESIVNSEEITEEELEKDWMQAMEKAINDEEKE